LDGITFDDSSKARCWLNVVERLGLAVRKDARLELTQAGAFWLHQA
jgi:hypothetical protein